jgi:hypothetical protein
MQATYIPCTKSHVSLPLFQRISPGPRHVYLFHNKASFYGEDLLPPCQTPKLKNHPLLAVCDCLFNVCSYPPYWRPFLNQQQRMCHAMVTGTHLSCVICACLVFLSASDLLLNCQFTSRSLADKNTKHAQKLLYYRCHTHVATYCVIIQTQRTQISGRNSNGTKHSGGPPEDGREMGSKHVEVFILTNLFLTLYWF